MYGAKQAVVDPTTVAEAELAAAKTKLLCADCAS